MQINRSRAALVAVVASAIFTGCLQESGVPNSHASPPAATPAAIPQVNPVAPTSAGVRVALPDFSALVEHAGPAVVNISVTSVQQDTDDDDGGALNDPFFDFFRRFGIPIPGAPGGGQSPQPHISQGIGSGFIVSSDGYILTNAHVVADATEVAVKLTDKRELKAKVIGFDRRTDVALIKVDATNLPVVKMANSDNTKVGEWVVAMGSPFGFENTVTAGIISAKSRKLPDENFVPFIQTDVAINPGNSGGPLFNMNGEVIGINSQIYSRSGGFMGISFAIPIDVAMKIKDQLQKNGKVSRGKLGVVIQGLDKELAASFGLDKARGALVSSLENNGPAEKAGIQAGDIILKVDDTTIEESGDLPRVIGDKHPNDTVKLQIWRSKSNKTISVKLGEQAAETVAARATSPKSSTGKLGIAVRPLNPMESNRLGITGGLLIERANGAAAKAGLRPGDVILAVGNQKVNDVEELRKLVDAAGKQIPLLVQRGQSRQYIVIPAS